MVKAKFTKQMIEIIQTLKGKTFISYFMDDDIFFDKSYCLIRIKTDSACLDLMNEIQEFPFLKSPVGDTEELSCFTCQEKNINEPFKPYLVDIGYKEINVNEKISEVSIISDKITITQENYTIDLDMALVIKTSHHTYIFSRQWYFDEHIFIHIDKDFNSIYSIDDVKQSWDNDGEFQVEVERTIVRL